LVSSPFLKGNCSRFVWKFSDHLGEPQRCGSSLRNSGKLMAVTDSDKG
jgi:hypothetical protein